MMMNNLKEARLAANLTQKEVSNLLEIPQRTWENWDAGRTKPPAYVEKLIIEKLEALKKDH